MKRKMKRNVLIAGTAATVAMVTAVFMATHFMRPFRFAGMQAPSDAAIAEVSEYFENSSSEGLAEYCQDNFLCGYYCGNVNPGHAFCSSLNLTFPERNFTAPGGRFR
jgi:hypothetical protein